MRQKIEVDEDKEYLEFTLIDNGNKIGSATVEKQTGHRWYLAYIAINHRYQGHGYGTSLLTAVHNLAKRRAVKQIYLSPLPDSIPFWESKKYQPDMFWKESDGEGFWWKHL